eukprot:1183785-Prorocentrum_minimum.AAC.2
MNDVLMWYLYCWLETQQVPAAAADGGDAGIRAAEQSAPRDRRSNNNPDAGGEGGGGPGPRGPPRGGPPRGGGMGRDQRLPSGAPARRYDNPES